MEMEYRKTYHPKSGVTELCTIGKDSSLKMLEFYMIELHKDESAVFETKGREAAFVFLSGNAYVKVDDGTDFGFVGGRKSVFEGKAHTVYAGRNRKVTFSTPWSCKIAVAAAPMDEDTESQLITPDMVKASMLGRNPYERETHFLVDGSTNARRLTVGEAWVTPGNWAGFPPHKHDVDNLPAEGVAEEIYYFLFQPSQGFAIQSMYTSDLSLDKSYIVRQDDLVEFPYGYHTTVAAPGYNSYFLWAMAGEHQGFYRSNDPEHDWVIAVENIDRRS